VVDTFFVLVLVIPTGFIGWGGRNRGLDPFGRDQTGQGSANGGGTIDPVRGVFAGEKEAEVGAEGVTVPVDQVVGGAVPVWGVIQLVED